MKEEIIQALQGQILTASEIARACGVSRQYVQQIAIAIGVFAYKKPPRVYLRKEKDPIRAKAKAFAMARGLLDPFVKYCTHKSNAKKRDIGFELTFPEWWGLWEPYYDKMGARKGCMCMCRTLDMGAYEVGNVRIDLVQNNGHDKVLSNYYKRGATLDRNRSHNEAIHSGFVLVDFGGVFDDPMDILERKQEGVDYY